MAESAAGPTPETSRTGLWHVGEQGPSTPQALCNELDSSSVAGANDTATAGS
jgi:hypothetical protein